VTYVRDMSGPLRWNLERLTIEKLLRAALLLTLVAFTTIVLVLAVFLAVL
jgi:hypothetical protein